MHPQACLSRVLPGHRPLLWALGRICEQRAEAADLWRGGGGVGPSGLGRHSGEGGLSGAIICQRARVCLCLCVCLDRCVGACAGGPRQGGVACRTVGRATGAWGGSACAQTGVGGSVRQPWPGRGPGRGPCGCVWMGPRVLGLFSRWDSPWGWVLRLCLGWSGG